MSKQISPLPWAIGPEHDYEIYDAKGDYLALMMDARDGDDEANAAFIVKASNSHEALKNALTLLAQKVRASGSMLAFSDELKHAEAALALAKGEA